jgi:FkbM family methyltransferase
MTGWISKQFSNVIGRHGALRSIEARTSDRLATEDDIRWCFRTLLAREMNPEEVRGHLGHVGRDLDWVLRQYMTSREFMERGILSYRTDVVEVATPRGLKLYVDPSDPIGGSLSSGAYEPHVIRVFEAEVGPGMRVLDIGANVGFFTMLAAQLVGPGGRVLAIEAMAENALMLEAGRIANGFDNVTVMQVAASDEPGLLALNSSYSNGEVSALSRDAQRILAGKAVTAMPLDLVAGERVDFIKIDVEGAEGSALRGLHKTIARDHPTIISEFTPSRMPGVSSCSGEDYLRFLTGHGYNLSEVRFDGEIRAVGQDIAAVMDAYAASGGDHIDILAKH